MIRMWWRAWAEALSSIRRNALLSGVSVSTVALCLLVLGAFVLAALNLQALAGTVEAQVEVRAFLKDGLSPQRTSQLVTAVQELAGVREVKFVSRGEALRRLGEQLGKDSGVLEAVGDSNPLPDAIEVKVEPRLMDQVTEALSAMSEVDRVLGRRELVGRILAVTQAMKALGLGLAALLAVATLVVIANTIRLTVFARRAEVRIMKLVGATDGFIRGPFVLEGMMLGFVGAVVASAAAWYGYGWLSGLVRSSLPFIPVLPRDQLLPSVALGLVALGTVLGALGSAISLRRFLRV
ncbi:MAG: permease-like cell division protein FtsX [Acetobacteraceae bacterium]|nr:permease-like cell division protein FtsX [Acetobacteraceae bacterium]